MILRIIAAIVWLAVFSCSTATCDSRPRLVVLISIDQFRADYLTRFEDLYLPALSGGKVGGFRYLMERGAYFPDAHHDHLPLATAAGHSVLLSGAPPYKSGIVGNDWWDYGTNRSVYCVQDDSSPLIGTPVKAIGISPHHLRVTTVGDELKMATGGQSKVFGIALKDRAAVLMAGHLADGVFWFDDSSGNWMSSRFFCKNGTLPGWISGLNGEKIPQSYFNSTWTPSVSAQALQRLWTPTGEYAGDGGGLGIAFPHVMSCGQTAPNQKYFRAFASSPFANEYVFTSAERLIGAEGLGKHENPDILAINLSSNDYIGHNFGPDSAEVLDVSVRSDRMLSKFLNALNSSVPGGLSHAIIVLTADHGAAPNPRAARDRGIRGGIWTEEQATGAAQDALEKELGAGKWVNAYIEPYLWLNRDLFSKRRIPIERAEHIASAALERVHGIYAAYCRSDALLGRMPHTDIGNRASVSFNPQVSGDVLIVSQPGFMPRNTEKGTSHSEPYTYDTRVPLLIAGFGMRPGTYTGRVSTLDIAPTLSLLLRVSPPSGSEGHILSRAITVDGPRK